VNWDTFLQTAVADDEVYDEEIDGHFWTMNYPVIDDAGQPTGDRISFSTTRPETMLGDTAVCVHPTDERYTHLIGKRVRIPLNGRLIPIVADALLADKTLGTGCVKVTPAHDPNDYACWTRNKEAMGEPINILNPDGTLNENGGTWQGLDRLVARDAVVAEMEKLGHFEKVEDRKIPMKHSDRSKTPIEPYLSEQWFVKMDTLAQAAIGGTLPIEQGSTVQAYALASGIPASGVNAIVAANANIAAQLGGANAVILGYATQGGTTVGLLPSTRTISSTPKGLFRLVGISVPVSSSR
jgi:valyl-tRNA synthetase